MDRLRALDGCQNHVDLTVAVGVDSRLKPGLVDREDERVEVLLRPRGRDAVVAGAVDIGLAQPASSAGEGVAVEKLDSPEPQVFVAQTLAGAKTDEIVEVRLSEHGVDADSK